MLLMINFYQSELDATYSKIQTESAELLNRYLQSETQLQEHPVGIVTIENKK
jgi:hypothetical protein